ncbi:MULTISPECIES: N,N-dimethylformamidase beta subunit family domain-containing protein [Streptomycetaceae]|uniref:Phosphoribosylamine-glycine ligase n=1 Tax=Streptantibioticus cattleyicolor (strain ATCC 35852 / DSM 46488 / JCM 4925 / NBRC 14057 / NRRL 8057) TaxID=1003195 RepID=F8JVK6_STREN|nr:N,N-dimethylformamidase beta subunit family domain-containing protein [Streptantibioticus cattleyicolor]AEW95704.1 phosphoribosylamine-glycine ligase [Streptantibioticus cattleyicolor NRRL 8057 = DSM 46488]MYS60250.1 phosphoribosylamine--glycine ligase [Streptomyces sp. SID5468]CCB76043.1 Phosphoribosylamine-glycine ligase [Streptantibioticus cattleyicolor NRRL 8057 = DSM 46488]
MGTDQIRRWDSGALAHAVTDPFGQGPLPWLRGREQYLDDGQLLPWYAGRSLPDDGADRLPGQRAGRRRRSTGLRNADDVGLQIKGFTSGGSVTPGGSVDFHVTVDPPQDFVVDIYRIGHYGGDGANYITSSPRLSGVVQSGPLTAGRTVSCHHWWLSWRLQVPSYWSTGAYVAVLTTPDGYRSHIPFTVRDLPPDPPRDPAVRQPPDYEADLLLLLPDVTWQAYNLYPEDGRTGASLYHAWDEEGRLLGEEAAAVTVCYDRPYAGAGLPLHVGHAYDFIRWAERYGYDLAYADARDLHAGRVDPTRYRGLVFPGHDEYWSVPMRRAVERARDHGTSLVFLSANTMYWQVELSPSASGAPDRLLTCRKRRSDARGRTALWRDMGEPEQLVLGVQYAGRVPEPSPLVVRNADHWLWEASGAGEGDELPGLVAGEADRYFPRTALPAYTARRLLAHSPYLDSTGVRQHQETSLYRAPSGAYVFASGTFAWSPALDRPGHVDPRIQRATANLLDRICKRD